MPNDVDLQIMPERRGVPLVAGLLKSNRGQAPVVLNLDFPLQGNVAQVILQKRSSQQAAAGRCPNWQFAGLLSGGMENCHLGWANRADLNQAPEQGVIDEHFDMTSLGCVFPNDAKLMHEEHSSWNNFQSAQQLKEAERGRIFSEIAIGHKMKRHIRSMNPLFERQWLGGVARGENSPEARFRSYRETSHGLILRMSHQVLANICYRIMNNYSENSC